MLRCSRSSTGGISASVSGPAKPVNGPQPTGSYAAVPGTQRQDAGLISDGGLRFFVACSYA